MSVKPLSKRYDGVSILLHWTIAILIIGLFASGLWMVKLGYYDDWYYKAPWWHKSFGVIVGLLVVFRWIWSIFRRPLTKIQTIPHWQHLLAKSAQHLMNLAVMVLVLSGYIVVTGTGDGLSVFDWFAVPAMFNNKSAWVDPAGVIHLWAGYFIIALASLHALAAIKHHFIDKDDTLKRMFGIHSGEKK